jgi:hypothetical protein
MSSVGNAGVDNREANQERHPVDLAAKTTVKTTADSSRPVSVSIRFYFEMYKKQQTVCILLGVKCSSAEEWLMIY